MLSLLLVVIVLLLAGLVRVALGPRLVVLVVAGVGLASSAAAQLPVVPGAPLTAGMRTRAAYGCGTPPVILHVTNLNDSGAGSVREAFGDSRPRVIVFDVSGYVTLASTVTIGSPCVTVAGQTAPTGGVSIRGNGGTKETGLYVSTHDVLVQHIRVRPGSSGCNSAVQFYGGGQANIVFDHTSISWGQDDNFAFNWTNGQSTDATVYRSISSEGILSADGSEACTGGGRANGHGMLIGAASLGVSVVQSLFATNFERNPYMQGGSRAVILNNLIYQWHGPWGIFFNNGSVDGSANGLVWYASAVGNRFIAGPNTCCTGGGDDPQASMFVYSTNNQVGNMSGNQIYRKDNTAAPPPAHVKLVEETNQYSYNPNVTAPPSQAPLPAGYVPLASSTLEQTLLPIVGARPTDRDAVDKRTALNVTNRTGTYVHNISEVGGFPTLPTNTKVFEPVADPHTVQPSGYTRLEEQLHALAAALEGGTVPPQPEPGPPDVAPASGTVFVRDSFTDPAGTALTAHRGELGATYEKQASAIDGLVLSSAGRVMSLGVGEGTLTLAHGRPLTASYDVTADLVALTAIPGHQVGIWARAAVADPLTALAFLYDVTSTTWTLSQFTASGFQTLGTCVKAITAGTTTPIALRVRDASVHGIVGGAQCTSSSAAVLHTAGLVGVSTYYPNTPDTDTTGLHLDNLQAVDVTTTEPPISLLTILALAIIGLLAVVLVILVALLLRAWAGPTPEGRRP